MDWISVKDKLPEDGQTCLVYGHSYCRHRERDKYLCYYDKEYGFVSILCCEVALDNVLYWLPAPDNPTFPDLPNGEEPPLVFEED